MNDLRTPSIPLVPRVGASSGWLSRLVARWRRHLVLKAVGTSLFMTAFFIAYFEVLRAPRTLPTEIPLTVFDAWIGFHPLALIPYASLWLYAILPSSLMIRLRELIAHAIGAAILSVAGLLLFRLWPTTTPAANIDWAAYPQMQFLKTIDASGNACPSLHVAFSVFGACWLARLLRRMEAGIVIRGLNVAWAAVIVYSTIATRQHVVIDALAGALLGGVVACVNLRFCPDVSAATEHAAADAPDEQFSIRHAGLVKLFALALWAAGLPGPWAAALFFVPDAWMLYHAFVPGASGFVSTYSSFNTDHAEVWLTIDDGPDEHDTPRLLDLLDEHDARATFFLIGERAARHPELVREIRRRGHEVAHHTHSHRCATFCLHSPAGVRRELDAALPLLTIDGAAPRRFRAPVGIKSPFLKRALAERGLLCVDWNVRSHDSLARDPDAVARRVLRRVRPGSIILMHEGRPLRTTVRVHAIARVLAGLRERGLRCVIPKDEQLR